MDIPVPFGTRTWMAAELTNALLFRRPYLIQPYTTLNEDLGILHNTAFPSTTYPETKFFAIGIGGLTTRTGSDGAVLVENQIHDVTDAALFKQIPFVLRQPGNDIAPERRSRYALRKEIVIGTDTYIAYWLRRIDMSAVSYTSMYRNIENGVLKAPRPVEPKPAFLNPTPVTLSQSVPNVINGDYIVTTTKLPLELTAEEVSDAIEACTILYGSATYARISEVAICAGIDHVVTVSSATGQFNFTDSIAVQIMAHLPDDTNLLRKANGYTAEVDMGSNNPMLTRAV